MKIKTKYADNDYIVKTTTYRNGNLCLQLVSNQLDDYIKASVNTDVILPADECMIKDYSENEGLLDELIRLGVVTKLGEYKLGFVTLHHCKVMP